MRLTRLFVILMLLNENLIFIALDCLLIFLLRFLCALFLLHELFCRCLLLVNSLILIYAFLAFAFEFVLHLDLFKEFIFVFYLFYLVLISFFVFIKNLFIL